MTSAYQWLSSALNNSYVPTTSIFYGPNEDIKTALLTEAIDLYPENHIYVDSIDSLVVETKHHDLVGEDKLIISRLLDAVDVSRAVQLVKPKTNRLIILTSVLGEDIADAKISKVKCVSNETKLVHFLVKKRLRNLSDSEIDLLDTYFSSDIGAILSVCLKLQYLGASSISGSFLDALHQPYCSSSDFADSLVSGRKEEALRLVSYVDFCGKEALGYLLYLVSILRRMNIVSSQGIKQAEALKLIDDVPAFLVRKYYTLSKDYDQKTVSSLVSLLAFVENECYTHSLPGIFESLIGLW